MPVTQVNESVEVQPNHVYVIPPNKYLMMTDSTIKVAERERSGPWHSPIDLFFRTLADAYGKDAIAVVLSGSGSDGVIGLRQIKEAGGFAIAQDPHEAEYDGMPRAAIDTALVDFVLPVAEIPEKLRALRDGAQRLQIEPEAEQPVRESDSAALRDILTLLRLRTGHDFSHYKLPTLLRRIGRRLQVHELESLPAYLGLLREQPEEVKNLLRDLLITVTNFFRDRDCFDYLGNEILSGLFDHKGPNDLVRIWSVGCATGEEAYSLGILALEQAAKRPDPPIVQIFATDIDEGALADAREGVYPANISLDVSSDHLRRFFARDGVRYRIKKELREIVLFALHNVLRDPPFSKLDLICCRNLLIYLNREMQERVLAIFHFALRPDGILFLGSSESAEVAPALFEPVDKKRRIYRRRLAVTAQWPDLIAGKWQVRLPDGDTTVQAVTPPSLGQLHQELVEQFGPPSVLIDEEYEILHVSAHAARYLHFIGGEPTRNLMKVIHPDLRLDLRAALLSAHAHGPESRRVRVQMDGQSRLINLTVRRVLDGTGRSGYYLVVFDESAETAAIGGERPAPTAGAAPGLEMVTQLENELQRTKDELRVTVEQYETSTEELRASNEELQAINEELRSATEELETSKEELQSVNEELTTVNQELREKIDEVGHANSDLQNLMASTDIGTVFLDRALRIKRYTPRAQELFNIAPGDIGRPLEHFTNKLDYKSLGEDAERVLSTLQSTEREVQAADGSWYLARMLPYRTLDDRIDGVVLTFVDITNRRRDEEDLSLRANRLKVQAEIVDLAHVLIREIDGRIVLWNTGSARLYGYEKEEAEGKNVAQLLKAEYPEPINEIVAKIEQNGEWVGELQHTTKSGRRIAVASHWVLHPRGPGEPPVILEVNNDITARRRAEEALRQADRLKDEFLAMLAHELRNPLGAVMTSFEVLRRAGGDSEAASRAQRAIERQLNHLLRLVEDLLDVERLSRGKIILKRERIDAETAIEVAVQMANEAISHGGHQLKIITPERERLFINADLARVTQILVNLVDNAAKYTPHGGHLELSLERQGSEAAFTVRDDGVGLDPRTLPDLFNMFSQSHARIDSEHPGLGVGLALVRQLAEMHGGSATAHSDGPGKGSIFVVRLPLLEAVPRGAPAPVRAAASVAAPDGSKRPRRVLVVDDNRDAADVFGSLLGLGGHEVEVAYSGAEALAAASRNCPEIVFLDLGMPGMSGYEAARQMKQQHPDIVLVAVSGWDRDSDRERARAAGFDHHLSKPTSQEQIEKILNEAPPPRACGRSK